MKQEDVKKVAAMLLVNKMVKDYRMVRGYCVEAFFEKWLKRHIDRSTKEFRVCLMQQFINKLRSS